MALLILNLPHRPTISIDGVEVAVNHDQITVKSGENSLLRNEDIVRVLDDNNIYSDYDRIGGVIINKPRAARFNDWAQIK